MSKITPHLMPCGGSYVLWGVLYRRRSLIWRLPLQWNLPILNPVFHASTLVPFHRNMEAEDPDYLCALAVSLNDANPARSNVVDRPLKNGESKRAAVLDAFARLLVHKGSGQVVAVGAGLHAGHIEFYVTENTAVSPLTVPHLHNICTRLIDIRATIQASPDRAAILDTISSPVHLKADTTEPAFASLRGLQRSLVSHSIERIQARFTKLHWPNKVDHVLACIKGPPANTRDDLSEGEQRALEELQASTIAQLSVRRLGDAVQLIQESIDQGPNYDVDKVRQACIALAIVVNSIPAHTMVSFDHFIFGSRSYSEYCSLFG